MKYKYLDTRTSVIRLKENEIEYKPTLDDVLDFWLNCGKYRSNSKDEQKIEREINEIHEMFDEFKHYLEENEICEPWIGLNRLGMFPLKWIKQ